MSGAGECACKGRETGCTADPPPGRKRCDNCSKIHNAREAERRAARRKAALCVVCGRRAVPVRPAAKTGKTAKTAKAGKKRKRAKLALTLCKAHRKYFVERGRDASKRRTVTPEAVG
jgi:hypothetical protein